MNRRKLLKTGGALAVTGATATLGLSVQAGDDALGALLHDLETIDGDRVYCVQQERLTIAARLRGLLGMTGGAA